ncbi:MAG: hypothetical protein IJB20_08755 [Clostridia bacterium]|nr:hypothetical protein [Clostridia bacterium]
MKKAVLMLMLIITLLTMSSTVFATESEVQIVYVDSYNEVPVEDMLSGVVYVYPNETLVENGRDQGNIYSYSTRDLTVPTNYWNVALKGAYEFAGSSESGELYTLYKFSGYTNYLVSVTNFKLLTRQTVNVYNAQGSELCSFNVPANSTAVYKVETGAIGWYLGFEDNCNVEGYVDKYSDEDVDGTVP